MSLGDLLRGLFRPPKTPNLPGDQQDQPASRSRGGRTREQEQAAEWLAAFESGALSPPKNIHDARGWDDYWTAHLKFGPLDQGFSDMMSSDPDLLGLLTRRGANSILCVGNGLSMEAVSLGVVGFRVTALDISGVAATATGGMLRDPDHPLQRIPGFRVADDGSLEFGRASQMEPSQQPKIHRSPDYPPRDGGTLTFVTGDLCNAGICPGPFDAVVERRTVQLFPQDEQIPALERLVARLSDNGVFVSHQHSGAWKPGDHDEHYAEPWLTSHGFALAQDRDSWDSPSRLARLMFSTG